MLSVLAWWAVLEVLGLLSLPYLIFAFRKLPDQGLAFAKVAGVLLLGYLLWVIGTVRLAPNGRGAAALALVLIAIGALLLFSRQRARWRGFRRRLLPALLLYEGVFLAGFLFWALIRAYNPEIDGTEKPMDFGLLNTAIRSVSFPPDDPWLGGHTVNYYYFGYLLFAGVTHLSGQAPAVAYNLALATLFAATLTGAWGLGSNLARLRVAPGAGAGDKPPRYVSLRRGPGRGWPSLPRLLRPALLRLPSSRAKGRAPRNDSSDGVRVALPRSSVRRSAALYGALAALLLVGAGNLEGSLEVFRWHGGGGADFWSRLAIKHDTDPETGKWRLLGPIADPGGPADSWYPTDGWWWWRATRVIDTVIDGESRDYTITEFPFFSFLLGDLHPHVLALPVTLLAIGFCLELLLVRPRSFSRWLRAWPAALLPPLFALGGLGFINGWDLLPYLSLYFATGLLVFLIAGRGPRPRLLRPGAAAPPRNDMGRDAAEGDAGEQAAADTPSGPGAAAPPRNDMGRDAAEGDAGEQAAADTPSRSWLGIGRLLPIASSQAPMSSPVSGGDPLPAEAGNESSAPEARREWIAFAAWAALLPVGVVLLYAPFYLSLAGQLLGPLRGPEFATAQGFPIAWWTGTGTRPVHFLLIWAPFLFGAAALIVRAAGTALSLPLSHEGGENPPASPPHLRAFAVLGLLAVAAAWVVLELLASGSGSASLVNRVWPLVPFSLSLVLAVRLARARGSPGLVFTLGLVAAAFFLFAVNESFHIQDIFGNRMNTVFKLSYQAWVLLAIASAGGVANVTNRPARIAFAVMVLAVCVYPLSALPAKTGGFQGVPTLDGLEHLQRSEPSEFEAQRWLAGHVPKQGVVVLEATGPQYSRYGRVSSNTGVPTVLGWAGHELQWRGSDRLFRERAGDIDRIYLAPNKAEVRALIEGYGVNYVYVGNLERSRYPSDTLDAFAGALDVAFRNEAVTIYGMRPGPN